MNNVYKLDLNDFIHNKSTALVGREKGEDLVQRLNKKGILLSKIEEGYNIIEILIPKRIMSINKSFFLGLFELRIQKLGNEKFRRQYIFVTDNTYIKNKIDRSISSALLSATQEEILGLDF